MKKLFLALVVLLYSTTLAISQNTGRQGFELSDITTPVSASGGDRSPSDIDCDTLRYPFAWEKVYYFINPATGTGYITGNNSYKDKAKAEYFTTFEAGTQITGMVVDFAVVKNANNPQITFAIWNNAGANGKPGAIIASTTKSLLSIYNDINSGLEPSVSFDQAYTVTGPFYAGIVLPSLTGDTLAFWCRLSTQGYAGTAWEQWENGVWYPFNHDESWGDDMQTTMTIHPVTCKTVGISEHTDPEASVHPNPATGVVNITTWKSAEKIRLEILTMTGNIAYSRSFPGAITNFNIDFGHLSKGVYMLRLSDGNRQHSQKLILE